MLWVGISIRVRCTTFCDKLCQWLATGRWFSPGASVSSINKPDHLDITEILLKVALNTIKLTNKQTQTKNPNDGEHESIRCRWLLTEIELFLFQCSSYHFFCRYRTSKRVDYQESDSEKENVKQPPLSLLEYVKERSNYNKWKKARITSIRLRKEFPSS
jgi:hypothetical protein